MRTGRAVHGRAEAEGLPEQSQASGYGLGIQLSVLKRDVVGSSREMSGLLAKLREPIQLVEDQTRRSHLTNGAVRSRTVPGMW